jgi:hypothetical protein
VRVLYAKGAAGAKGLGQDAEQDVVKDRRQI